MVIQRYRALVGCLLSLVMLSLFFSEPFCAIYRLPTQLCIVEGAKTSIPVYFPFTVSVIPAANPVIAEPAANDGNPAWSKEWQRGQATIQYKLLGYIPLRSVQVDVVPAFKVVPGGQSIGVVLQSHGVMVVGYSPISEESGKQLLPAKEAGIMLGDLIVSINGVTIESDMQAAQLIKEQGEHPLAISFLHEGEMRQTTVQPVYCDESKRYRVGLFIRDSAAGVGTLTFYEPESRRYGALGHIITDNDTNQPIDCAQGKIVAATVSGIHQGKRGYPGEKMGIFIEAEHRLGSIEKNTKFGIYGDLTPDAFTANPEPALPVGSRNEVQTGAAEMLTVIEGQKVERFSIEIQKINLQEMPEGKGMIVKVTDPQLLSRTGGIIQGMSGSPIIQNGRVIGAITHVLVHDPSKGYACFIDWMLMESGIFPKPTTQSGRLFWSQIPQAHTD